MKNTSRIRQFIDTILGYFLAVLMSAMVIDVVWGVISRFLLNNPSSFTDELAGYLLIWVGLLGASLASGKGMHLAIDLLPRNLNPPARHKLQVVIEILISLFAIGILIIGGLRLVYITLKLGQNSPSLGLPVGYVYMVLPLSGILILYYSIDNIYRHLTYEAENNNDE
ncbi:MAG TPA: TRAP transporter small permease [Balneolaceae bacterium]|nr:TRAP transporter small permease [Balneolaceae bacterium]